MADILRIKPSDRLRFVVSIITLAGMFVAVIGAWYVLGARVGALEVADTVSAQRVQTIEAGSVSRDLRIEEAQDRTEIIVVGNQRALAAIDAKIDILLEDRRTAP